MKQKEVPMRILRKAARRGTTDASAPSLRVPALAVQQGRNRTLYSFAIDGKVVDTIATVSRLHRQESSELGGYQRPEVVAHVAEIRAYLESEDPMVPNAIVIAFDERVRFEPSAIPGEESDSIRFGHLVIPVDRSAPTENRPGWIVDGQQRIAAIRDANVKSFPVCVTAFVTGDMHEQREQFILVNSTKPLSKGLIYELLPTTEARLPKALERRRFPAQLLDRLNRDHDSPLRGLISTPTNPGGRIKDNSVLRMLENSLSNGALFEIHRSEHDHLPTERMLHLLKSYWSAVAEVFDEEWKLPPRHSRLVHGAGIVSMGFVMDAVVDHYRHSGLPTSAQSSADLQKLKPACHWTSGEWVFADGAVRRWNEIQNTSKDVERLVDHLLTAYTHKVWRRRQGRTAG